MKNSCLGTALALVTTALLGCTSSGTRAQPDASAAADASTTADASVPHGDFELRGSWLYLGPGDVVHTLAISNTSIVYTGIDGDWSSTWSIKSFDNDLERFQLVFQSGTGSYYPTGQSQSGTYDFSGAILTVQLADGLGSYPAMQSPGSCTVGGTDRIANCGLYMKQN